MSQLFLSSIDLSGNQLLNAVLHTLSSDPGSPIMGQFWYNSTSDVVKYQDDVGVKILASTAYVLALRLDQFAVPTADVSMNSQKITNLGTPSASTDAATKWYVDSLANGTDWKNSVRVISTANITLSGEQTIDSVSVVAGNRVLVAWQTDGEDNGIYVCASGAWSRSTDADSSAEVTAAMSVFVEEGTVYADTQRRLTTNWTITLGTTELVFAQIGAGTSYTEWAWIDISGWTISIDTTVVSRKVSATITADSSTTDFVITHSLWTRDVIVQVAQSWSPYATVLVDVERNSTSQVTVKFAVAPTTGTDYRVTVMG